MAKYKDASMLDHATGPAFDQTHGPGTLVPVSGIYRCVNCSLEYANNKGNPFPPQNHHQHPNRAPILWQLVVATQQSP